VFDHYWRTTVVKNNIERITSNRHLLHNLTPHQPFRAPFAFQDNRLYINKPLILILCQFIPAHTLDTKFAHSNLYTDQRLDNWKIVVRFPKGTKGFSLLKSAWPLWQQTVSYSRDKVAGQWNWSFTSTRDQFKNEWSCTSIQALDSMASTFTLTILLQTIPVLTCHRAKIIMCTLPHSLM